jgi:TPR repeat protein
MLEQLVSEQAHPQATYTLGMLLLDKVRDIPCPPDKRDDKKGKRLLKKAADAQVVQAQYELAHLLLTSSQKSDQRKGNKLLQRAAAQGFQPAIDDLNGKRTHAEKMSKKQTNIGEKAL